MYACASTWRGRNDPQSCSASQNEDAYNEYEQSRANELACATAAAAASAPERDGPNGYNGVKIIPMLCRVRVHWLPRVPVL